MYKPNAIKPKAATKIEPSNGITPVMMNVMILIARGINAARFLRFMQS